MLDKNKIKPMRDLNDSNKINRASDKYFSSLFCVRRYIFIRSFADSLNVCPDVRSHYAATAMRRQCKFSPTGTIILISRSRNFALAGINIPARAHVASICVFRFTVYVSENSFQGRS